MPKLTRSCRFCSVGALAGPSGVARNGQITIPKSILAELGWDAGNKVMFRVDDDDPGSLVIVPYDVFQRRYELGSVADRLRRDVEGGAVGEAAKQGAVRDPKARTRVVDFGKVQPPGS